MDSGGKRKKPAAYVVVSQLTRCQFNHLHTARLKLVRMGAIRRPAGRAGSGVLRASRRHAARSSSSAMEAGGVPRRLRHTSPLAAQCEALARLRTRSATCPKCYVSCALVATIICSSASPVCCAPPVRRLANASPSITLSASRPKTPAENQVGRHRIYRACTPYAPRIQLWRHICRGFAHATCLSQERNGSEFCGISNQSKASRWAQASNAESN